jgi:Putative Ig domain
MDSISKSHTCVIVAGELRITVKGTFNITITVDPPAPPPIEVAPTQDLGHAGVALPEGTVIPIRGGVPPYTITNVQGTVPPGVTINSDCTESGTPTEPGSFPLTVDVQDSAG